METVQINKDIEVGYVKASSFPEGITESWQQLHQAVPKPGERKFYGISHGEQSGGIVYMAAVEQTGEAKEAGLKRFIIPKGDYIKETISDWKNNIEKIPSTFQKLLATPNIDPQGFCLEEYDHSGDVKCMVKLA